SGSKRRAHSRDRRAERSAAPPTRRRPCRAALRDPCRRHRGVFAPRPAGFEPGREALDYRPKASPAAPRAVRAAPPSPVASPPPSAFAEQVETIISRLVAAHAGVYSKRFEEKQSQADSFVARSPRSSRKSRR